MISVQHRRHLLLVCVLALGLLLLGASLQTAPASAAPIGLDPALVNDEFVVGGMQPYGALSADWLPDGRMIVVSQAGKVYLIDPAAGAKVLLYTMPDVDSRSESGALDIVADLSFATNRSVYVYYSSSVPRGPLRIAKLVLDAALTRVVSNTTIWTSPGKSRLEFGDPTVHIGGSLDIGPDGKFYLSIGDAFKDPTGAQDLTHVFGKILRINMDGSVPDDNPQLPGQTIGEIWAYGLRNPYRAQFERGRTPAAPQGTPSGRYWIGDVGGNVAATAYEEVNIGQAGANYGWPLCEGPLGPPKAGPSCPTDSGPGTPALTITPPVHFYRHTAGADCCFNKAIMGGQMYRSGPFPLSGFYIYGDYPSSTISWLQVDANGNGVDSGQLKKLQTNFRDEAPVWVDVGPDGNIYFFDLFTGSLRRLTYGGPAIASTSASVVKGLGPLSVDFSAAVTNTGGDPVTYAWQFDDGTTVNGGANVTHVYQSPGTYNANVRVSASGHVIFSTPIKIQVGTPPTPTITSPPTGTLFSAGDTITVTGMAKGAFGAPLPASSLSWQVLFKHDQHEHPVLSNVVGSSVQFKVPVEGHDFEGDTSYRAILTATEGTLPTSTSIDLIPRKITIPVRANVAINMAISGITQVLPFDLDTIPGFQHRVDAPATACISGVLQRFVSWSDGGTPNHVVSTQVGVTLTATYAPTADSCESKYIPLAPKRIFDSRSGPTPEAKKTFQVAVAGHGGVPKSGATAVVLNVTAVSAADPGFVTVWPSGTDAPVVSNLNLRASETAPNLVTVSLGADGTISILPTTSAHILVDVFGYFVPSATSVDGRFVPLPAPRRLYDTRDLGPTPLADSIRTVTAAGSPGVPATGAEAVVLNVTAVGALEPGFVTVWPSGETLPEVSNINVDHVDQTRANQVIAKLGSDGAFKLYTSGGAHLIVDVVGYFTAPGSGPSAHDGLFVPVSPHRALDTRSGAQPAPDNAVTLGRIELTGVPSSGVLAVAGNTTVVDADRPGFLTVFPAGQLLPGTSNVNVELGQTIANHTTTVVTPSGISLQPTVGAHLLMDLAGWYTT